MRLTLFPWLLAALLAGCATPRIAAPVKPAGDRRPSEILASAPAIRARADSASQTPTALGSYYRRVWGAEFERMLRPLRATGLIATLPTQLVAPTLTRWQTSLNDTWALTDPGDVHAVTDVVIAEAAPMRDAVALWVRSNEQAPAAITSAIAIAGILFEIAQEAELLALRDSGDVVAFEAFITRYPLGPYTGSVLYALGAMHEERRDLADAKAAFDRMLERFPAHPSAAEVRERLGAL